MLSIPEIYQRYQKFSPLCEQVTELMQQYFAFYTEQRNQFFTELNKANSNKTLAEICEYLRQSLFNIEHCKQLEGTKERFLFQKFNIKVFLENETANFEFATDLAHIINKICDLLQTHIELYKYNKAADSTQLVALILKIDKIIIDWSTFSAKYSALLTLLKDSLPQTPSSTEELVEVFYNLPEEKQTPHLLTAWINFLTISAEFIANIMGLAETTPCKIMQIEMSSPLRCLLSLPASNAKPFKQFCHYLNVDVLKRETLLKFSMEVLRLEQGSETSKTVILNFHKKLAKQLNLLHKEGSMDAIHHTPLNVVETLAELCKKLEKFSVLHSELLQIPARPANAKSALPKPTAHKPIQQEHVGFLTSFSNAQKHDDAG